MTRLLVIALATLTALAPLSAKAQDPREMAYVIGLMESMNALSIRFNREVCGYILQDPDGSYRSTKASWGGHASCASLPVEPGVRLVSSWHTHAAYDRNYDNEVPSIQDIQADRAIGVTGWVGTPGGRLWYVDAENETLRVACDKECLPTDPNATDQFNSPIPAVMSVDQLYRRFGRIR